MKVAIQGASGAFHEVAARFFFKTDSLEIVPCVRFEDEFEAILKNRADCAVIAVENSVVGTLLSNLSLITESGMGVFAELSLKVEQNLVALKGEALSDIREVRSHPVAIQQCSDFLEPLRRDGVQIVDAPDTAMSAEDIARRGLKGVAAIAGVMAAERYGLSILASGIESNKNNFTRFLFIAPLGVVEDFGSLCDALPNKASVCFTLPHRPGELAAVLLRVSDYNLNITKIQSLPVPGKEWEYLFFMDMTFDDREDYRSVIRDMGEMCDKFTLLGEYPQGAVVYPSSMQPYGSVDVQRK